MDTLLDVVRLKYYELQEFYEWTLTIADDRTKGWLLVDSPQPMIAWSIAYLFLVWLGPKYMENRKPYDLKYIMILYNLSMAAVNGYIAVTVFISASALKYSYICQPVGNSSDPYLAAHELQIAKALWWYYFSKLLEYTDTAIFVLRKRNSQLTFLHCYHHFTMFILWWIGVKWVPGGSPFLMAMLNSSVHVLMYLYYGLSAFGPAINKYLWWKKYLTIIQLLQFCLALVMGIISLFRPCGFPIWMSYTLVFYMISFIFLFSNFYYNAYTKGKRNRHEMEIKKQSESNGNVAKKKEKNGHVTNGSVSNGKVHSHVSNGSAKQQHANGRAAKSTPKEKQEDTLYDFCAPPEMKEMYGQAWLESIFARKKAKRH